MNESDVGGVMGGVIGPVREVGESVLSSVREPSCASVLLDEDDSGPECRLCFAAPVR